MEILEEQLQSLQQQEPVKQEEDAPEPTVISRRQAELEAAKDRLQRTAQIKQQRSTGATDNTLSGEKDLEDLLLKTQGGLVLLHDLHNRRDRQWKEVLERYGYQQPSPAQNGDADSSDQPQQQITKPPQWLQTLVSKLLILNQRVAATSHCAIKWSQLTTCLGNKPTRGVPSAHLPILVNQRAHALEAHHRLRHAIESIPETQTSPFTDFVHIKDVNLLMQFNNLRHQQDIALERFCIRLKWLPVSHRFHIRQRMLALVHQQKLKNTPRPNASTAYRNSKDHLHCPLFVMSTPHFAAELAALALKYSLSVVDSVDVRDSAEEYQALRQGADAFLVSAVSSFPPDSSINADGSLEYNLESLVHSYTRNIRWELIQRGFIGNCEPIHEHIEDTLIALRNDHKIDSLLANEWELLSLDDVGYLCVRLEALSRAHMNRAKVDVEKSQPIAAGEPIDDDINVPVATHKSALPHSWNPDALYSLYVLRVSACRAKRLSLLRLLNFFHFIQLCQTSSLYSTSKRYPMQKSPLQTVPTSATSADNFVDGTENRWTVTKCDKTGDYIITRPPSPGKDSAEDEDTDNNSNRDQEFIFAAARRDLEVLELQMLRIASIFIFKQEYDSLPTSPRKHSNDRFGSDHESDSVVTTIDRLQVLRDVYDCEVTFQHAKAQMAETLLASGLQFTPRNQDLSDLGFKSFEGQAEPFADTLFPLLQRRPLIDYSHAYFFESYAAETILLELQVSLVQQMEKQFQRAEWCGLQEFAFGDSDSTDDEQRQLVCRRILGSRALSQLYSQQHKTLREADEKWFSPSSVGEFHALQHALLEQTLVVWSLVNKLELPGRPIRCLERTAGDLLLGSGWQLVFPPQLLSDVCRTLHEQISPSRSLIECVNRALELEEWRRELAKSVYEAHLLERVHHFQFGFVKEAPAFDAVAGGEQARHLTFFFDFAECDRERYLQPIAMELEVPMFRATNAISASRPTVLRSGDSKSVSEWLQAQLSALQCYTDDCSEQDDVATEAKHSEDWRRSLLSLQQQYVSHLHVSVSYQDAVGADVFEFAASYPYVCLANSLAPEASFHSDEPPTVAMDLSTVRAKYAKEITDKMTEEMRTNCFPYWKRLENLKQQLQERFTTAPNQANDGLKAAFASLQPGFHLELDMLACGNFLLEENYHPRLLIALNNYLRRLRNEKRLINQLSTVTRTRCAFAPPSSGSDRNTSGSQFDEDQPSGLTKWLMVKLHQLKVDLQIHERPKVEQLLLTPPASCTSPPASAQRAQRTFGMNRSLESTCSDSHVLLQMIPSFRSLLHTFSMTSNYERPQRGSSGGAASAHAARLHEHREETLCMLLSIFDQLNCSINLLRVRCGSRFANTRHKSLTGGKRHLPSVTSPPGGAHTGLGRLERWQVQFHQAIRQLLDNITSRLSPDAAVAISDLFDFHSEHLQNQHHATLMRQEIWGALTEANTHLARILRCTTQFALLQTYQKDAGIRIRKRREYLIILERSLGNVETGIALSTEAVQAHIKETTISEPDEKGGGTSLGAEKFVLTAEKAFFGEARPREREREWHAFNDAVSKYEPRDSTYIALVTRLLELHRVYIDENCRVFLLLGDQTAPSIAMLAAAENQALVELNDLWERFHMPTWDSLVGEKASHSKSQSQAPIVGGENLHLKKRLLGTPGLEVDSSSKPGSSSVFSSPKELSFALRSLYMGSVSALVQFCNTGLLVLPAPNAIEEQLHYLHTSMEMTWVNTDAKEMEEQYRKFIFHRKKHREHQRTPSAATRRPLKTPPAASDPSRATLYTLLSPLSKYYHEQGIPGENLVQLDPPSNGSSVPLRAKAKTKDSDAVFIVPAPEMARFIHDSTVQCMEHSKQLLEHYNSFMQQLHAQCQTAALDRQKIEKQWSKSKVEERIRREAFAVDHAFHLYFEVEALRKQLSVLEARRELDQQALRCDLHAEYDEKLRTMHVELLNKQQKFAEYRTTVQRELETVIQGAHSQFVDQLLDYSGALPSTRKSSVTTLLRGQQDIVRIKSENAAMKQALLKVQALGDMQQQTESAAREREVLLTQRYTTAEALQRSEVEQLQAYVKQLEGNLSKLSQEKTYFQVKWTTAQKQMEATAQRRREAKVRALSASYTRITPPIGATISDDDGLPNIVPPVRVIPNNASDIESVTDVSTVRPGTAASTLDSVGKQDFQRLETQYLNSTRHFQNEIRRLQQQVTREIREKAAIAEQLTQLRQYESAASIQTRDGLPFVDDPQSLRTPRPDDMPCRKDYLLPSTPRRTQSASPRTSSKPSSCVAAPPDRTTTPRRPSSSFSRRASLLRAQVTVGSGAQPPLLAPCSNTATSAASAPSSRPSTASSTAGTSARKFQVVKRDVNAVGGVAGVSNTFSVREPLPYR
ncbi:unnamed protein product [Phytophthora lilii]|uniref:Unnamed protein product n=1 Tax=Phytophthora lilii TaxID=2077276 RepID=A0A9W7D8V2_9STRA|nr:unnamed protein product [Phytophthora lilii]